MVGEPTHLSLFSGIGGLDLGLEWAGFRTVGQVESDPWCRGVLHRRFPWAKLHDDVATAVPWWRTAGAGRRVDLVSGGLPCQPFSIAGRKRGVNDDRWLWPAFRGVVREVRPNLVLVENVAHILRSEAFGTILGDLATLGFDAEWCVLSACAVGAPHVRRRLFILAHANRQHGRPWVGTLGGPTALRGRGHVARTWDRPPVRLAPTRGPGGVVDGDARRMVQALGNAVVPQLAETIGRRLIVYLGGSPA